MRSYDSYIGGRDVGADRHVHVLRASALLADFLPNLRLKRELERGQRDDAARFPQVVARCALTSDEDLENALVAADTAGRQWAAADIGTRMRFAERVHQEIRRRSEEFVDVLVAEGHPRRLAEWEVAGVLNGTSPQMQQVWRSQLRQEFTGPNRRIMLVRKPDGVVVLSPPQNAAASNSVLGVSALVAGNALVVKAPRSCPYGVMFVWREIIAPVLEEVGAPAGTLNLVCGLPKKILDGWLSSPLVDDVFFFGGSRRGIEIGAEAVARGKKPVLELAGNDGCVIWADADLDRAAEALTESFFGSGQICMVPKYAVVHPAVAERFLTRLVALAEKIRPGYPEDPETLLSPVIQTDEYFAFLAEATEAGAQVLTGGHRLEVDGTVSPTGPFVAPTVLRVDGLADARRIRAVREETFFPLLPVIVPTDDRELLDDVIDFVNGNAYGLRNSVWATQDDVVQAFVERVTNGGLLKINDSHIGFVPHLSTHGGTGLTGGPFGELNYPLLRTSHLQGISIGTGIQPSAAVFEVPTDEELAS